MPLKKVENTSKNGQARRDIQIKNHWRNSMYGTDGTGGGDGVGLASGSLGTVPTYESTQLETLWRLSRHSRRDGILKASPIGSGGTAVVVAKRVTTRV